MTCKMQTVKLFFTLELGHQTKIFKPLSEYGEYFYDGGKKRYIWRFPVKYIPNVLALLGKPVKVTPEDFAAIEKYAPPQKKDIVRGSTYGTGFIEVRTDDNNPGYFIVTTVRERKPQNISVSFEQVRALWKAIKKQPLNKKISTAVTAKNYCEIMNITDFNINKGDKFNWKYFSGNRKMYLQFYSALKVLCSYGAIEHVIAASKSGIVRKHEKWEIQTEL